MFKVLLASPISEKLFQAVKRKCKGYYYEELDIHLLGMTFLRISQRKKQEGLQPTRGQVALPECLVVSHFLLNRYKIVCTDNRL